MTAITSMFGVSEGALEAFAEVMRQRILCWDDAKVMDAISFHKAPNPTEIKTWEKMEPWPATDDVTKGH